LFLSLAVELVVTLWISRSFGALQRYERVQSALTNGRNRRFPVIKSLNTFDFMAMPNLNKFRVLESAGCE